jgi:hypothetical protein
MMKLTRDVLESFPACKYKAYLKLIESHTLKDGVGQVSADNTSNHFDITSGIGPSG